MNSCEKVMGLRERLLSQEPQDDDSQQMLQTLAAFVPLLPHVLSQDPDQLDALLERFARYALICRSDDAVPMAVQACEGETGSQGLRTS